MKLLWALIATCHATVAFASDTGPEWQVRSLMVEAIASPIGQSRGQLHGPFADAMRTRFETAAPIQVEVTTLRRYRQPGCSRLNVRFRQDGVVVTARPAGRPQTLDVGIDYCSDGSPPRTRR